MSNFTEQTRQLLNSLADRLFQDLQGCEDLNINLSAEDQTYLRLNNSQVRQATAVEQRDLVLTLHRDGKSAEIAFQLSGQLDEDLKSSRSVLARLREETAILPPDAFQVPMQNHGESQNHFPGNLPTPEKAIQIFTAGTQGTDFTGLYAAGPLIRANRNSKGQNHWFSNLSFFIDYSLYTKNAEGENKAVKSCYADQHWNEDSFQNDFQAAKNKLSLLKRPSKKMQKGGYRAYLAPAAAGDMFNMLNWGALSFSAFKKGQCAFQKLQEGQQQLSSKISISENFNLGIVPQFNSNGEVAPSELPLIEQGKLIQFLVSSRSAKEYNVRSNSADSNHWFGEYLRSLEVKPGRLEEQNVLKELGTGLYLGNLHYLNWSDIQSARVTGMTRYACFWVENGEIQAPIQEMRFDESLFRTLGSELLEVSQQSSIIPEVGTYGCRALGGHKVPGLLLNDFRLTL